MNRSIHQDLQPDLHLMILELLHFLGLMQCIGGRRTRGLPVLQVLTKGLLLPLQVPTRRLGTSHQSGS